MFGLTYKQKYTYKDQNKNNNLPISNFKKELFK